MIRKSTNNDLEKIMQIWLDTNISVHNYIPQEYWTSNEKYVKEAIRDVGLGPYINGNGEYCKYILRTNPNFKETKVKGEDFKNLPAGCIIVYDKYDAGYGKDGHVEITLGDGKACSDVITEKIEPSKHAYVFIPV